MRSEVETEDAIQVSGRIVDVVAGRIFYGEIVAVNGTIRSVHETPVSSERLIMPGFVDAHVHIESSMLPPAAFAQLACVHGTVATVSDPHEIANVLGVAGVEYMMENAATTPFKFYFGAPSCVPATSFETAGATLEAEAVAALLDLPDIRYLAEMMNFPGVLAADPQVMAKIEAARQRHKVIDGHAPGLRGDDACRYAAAGISTDHECFTLEEAEEKLQYGMKIIIREGSAAKNFDTLIPLLERFPDRVMFCSDDKHPDALVAGHINELVARALAHGIDPITVIRAVTLNPVRHYGLDVGLLQPGDPADFIVVDDLRDLTGPTTWISGICVARKGRPLTAPQHARIVNRFHCDEIGAAAIRIKARSGVVRAIKAMDGQIVTGSVEKPIHRRDGLACTDIDQDILKLVVVNRYRKATPAVAFVTGVGLKHGAFAGSVAHDCHNIIAVGVDDNDIVEAINLVIRNQGGLSWASGGETRVLPLPIAGLMSADDGYTVARNYTELDRLVKTAGVTLSSPFMTLSFLALLVIPELKLSDKGLFDGRSFSFVDVFV